MTQELYLPPDPEEISFVCDCHDRLHSISFTKDDEDDDEWLWIWLCVTNVPFWHRVWRALKYVFNTDNTIVGEMVLRKDKVGELVAFLSLKENERDL